MCSAHHLLLPRQHHQRALTWLEDTLVATAQGSRLRLLPMVTAGFVRLVTHPQVFVEPTPLAAAQEFLAACGVLLDLQHGQQGWGHESPCPFEG